LLFYHERVQSAQFTPSSAAPEYSRTIAANTFVYM
jgi:hypothetical protein